MLRHNDLQLAIRWEAVTNELLDRSLNFPKRARFTFSMRLESLALDVLERITDARFSTGLPRDQALSDANRLLARIRVLLRLAHGRHYLSTGALESLTIGLDECGRALGAWLMRERASR